MLETGDIGAGIEGASVWSGGGAKEGAAAIGSGNVGAAGGGANGAGEVGVGGGVTIVPGTDDDDKLPDIVRPRRGEARGEAVGVVFGLTDEIGAASDFLNCTFANAGVLSSLCGDEAVTSSAEPVFFRESFAKAGITGACGETGAESPGSFFLSFTAVGSNIGIGPPSDAIMDF